MGMGKKQTIDRRWKRELKRKLSVQGSMRPRKKHRGDYKGMLERSKKKRRKKVMEFTWQRNERL